MNNLDNIEKQVKFYGGKWMAFVPIFLSIVLLLILTLKNADIPAYWFAFLMPLILGIIFAKDKTLYANAIIEGMCEDLSAILILAIILSGINGTLLNESGVVLTLVWKLYISCSRFKR